MHILMVKSKSAGSILLKKNQAVWLRCAWRLRMETESEARIVERKVEKRSGWRVMINFAGFIILPKLYEKILHNPDNHDGVITHLEPDSLECEVKWTLGSITMKKVNGCDVIPVDLFKILKDDAMKVLHSICQQIWKTQQSPQDWKRSVFIPIPKKGNAKWCSNYCTIAFLTHTLAK